MSNYLCSACICTYTSIDIKDIKIGCVESSECLCLNSAFCCALDEKDKGIGMVTESDEICKIGLYICNLGLKKPTVLCAQAQQILCLKGAASLPFDGDYVGAPVCACCFVKLYPEVGILKEAPTSAAISR